MNKNDLIGSVADASGLSKGDATKAVEAVFESISGALAKGDEVVTAGGILGKVVSVGDGFVTIEIAESVQIKVQKFQVSSLVPKGTLKGG